MWNFGADVVAGAKYHHITGPNSLTIDGLTIYIYIYIRSVGCV